MLIAIPSLMTASSAWISFFRAGCAQALPLRDRREPAWPQPVHLSAGQCCGYEVSPQSRRGSRRIAIPRMRRFSALRRQDPRGVRAQPIRNPVADRRRSGGSSSVTVRGKFPDWASHPADQVPPRPACPVKVCSLRTAIRVAPNWPVSWLTACRSTCNCKLHEFLWNDRWAIGTRVM